MLIDLVFLPDLPEEDDGANSCTKNGGPNPCIKHGRPNPCMKDGGQVIGEVVSARLILGGKN